MMSIKIPHVGRRTLNIAGAILSLLVVVAIALWIQQSPFASVQSTGGGSSFHTKYIKVATDSVLRFVFAEPIQKASAEESIIIPDGIKGSLDWEDDVLVFHPSAPLALGTTHTFAFKEGMLREDGRPLPKELSFIFSVDGPPTIVSRVPSPDSVHIPSDAVITMLFDRPMVPLTHVYGQEEQQLRDWPVTISPVVEGTWRWLGTSTVEFRPATSFASATRYTVTVPAGITNGGGDATAEDFSWSFDTVRPQLLSTDPPDGYQHAGQDTELVLHFNVDMDLETLRPFIAFRKIGGENLGEKSFQLVYGKKTEDEKELIDTQTVVLIPNQDLTLDSEYQLVIDVGAPAMHGNLGLEKTHTINVHTAGPFFVQRSFEQYNGVEFVFSNPYSDTGLKEYIAISPEPENWDDYDLGIDEWSMDQSLSLYPSLKPSTTYTFTMKAGLKDRFGQSLAEDSSFTMTTPALEPRVFIHSKGEFGIFERDKPPIYYLNALNVSRLDVDVAPLSLQDFFTIQRNQENDYEFSPDLSSYAGSSHFALSSSQNAQNEWQAVEFNVEEKLKSELKPGMYGLTLQAPEYVDYRGKQIVERQYFALTNMGITLKYTGKKALVWVVDITTGKPVQGAKIALYSYAGSAEVTGATDAEGFFEADLPSGKFEIPNRGGDPAFWVTAEKDDDIAFVGNQWAQGVRAYDFGYSEDFLYINEADYESHVYLYTDRPLYRAGHTVSFKGVARLRDQDGVLHTTSQAKRSVRVSVLDALDKEIYNETLDLTSFGSFNGTLPIAEDASLGTYTLRATILPDADIAPQYHSESFQVLAYRKPEFKTDITFEQDDYFSGDTIKATLEGAYYFGAPMSGAQVSWRAFSTDYYFNQYTDGWYSFSDDASWCWWDCQRHSSSITTGEGVLDERGKLPIAFPLSIAEKDLSQVVSIEASITDRNNQQVSSWTSVPMHKANVYVGIRPEHYGVEPGEDASVQLVTVLPDGSPAPSTSVTLTLYERKWNSIRKKGVDGQFYWDNEVEDTQIHATTVRTNSDGKTVGAMTIPKGGSYRIVATVKDAAGREAKAATTIYAYSQTYFNWPRSNSDRIEIIADKPEYAVGETAKLIVKSPYQGAGVQALVTVERENIMQKFVMPVASNALPIEIPITGEMIPNAYVSVVLVKPRQGETFNDNGLDTGLPAFKMGLERLKVETTKKEVSLTIETDQKKYLPRENVDVHIRTVDSDGNPVASEVSLSVVDMSVLALTGFQKPDLVQFFYTTRPLGVRTAQMLLYMLERFKPGSKGGGGGDGDAEGKRDTFKDTAYWNPTIVTDTNGEASVSFALPDNLTTWQVLGVANTKESTFGAETIEIIETKNVIVRPVRPRFAVHRDEILLGAIVHNFMDEKKKFTVSLSGDGFTSLQQLQRTVSIDADGLAKMNFPVRIDAMDSVRLNFTAETEGARDEIEETIPVYLFATPHTVATSGVIDEAVEEQVYAPNDNNALDLSVQVNMSPTVATYLPAGLQYVSDYSYSCGEQIMSQLLPNISLKMLQGFEAFQYVSDEALDAKVVKGIEQLYPLQRSDGGFGYWAGSFESSPALTAYIVYGLQQSKAAGFAIDQAVIDRAHTYLLQKLREKPNMQKPWEMSDALRAQILFTLVEGGTIDVALLNNFYDKREDLPLFAKAFYVMALQKGSTTSLQNKAETLLKEIKNHARISPRGVFFEEDDVRQYRWSMNTNTRTSALILMAIVRGEPGDPLLPRMVRHLLSVREDGHWDTTQSTAFTLLAFIEFLDLTDELNADFTTTLSLNGEQVHENAFDAENILASDEFALDVSSLKRDTLNAIAIQKEGEGMLYYDLVMSYIWLADSLPPVDEGMSITRTIEPMDSKDPTLKAGSMYKVTLNMSVPDDRHFVGVESPLPAGFEAIDLSLKTEQQSLQAEVNKREYTHWYDWWRDGLRYFTHTEFRDDRVFLFADYLPAGVYKYEYLVRASVPGTFYERPARMWEMYFPEIFGQTSGSVVTIEDADE